MSRVTLPEKRSEVLFCRVTAHNKEFVAERAQARGVSESVYLDYLLTRFREQHDRQQEKSKGGD